MMRPINVGLVGYGFMGKAHSNAYLKAPRFFDLPAPLVMRAICGRTAENVKRVAKQWGWETVETDYRTLVVRDDIDLVDICTDNRSHHEIAMAAIRAGKHVACEKPLALNAEQALRMARAAKEAQVVNTVWFNYRRCPAIGLARRLVQEGRIGRIYHVRATYLQDWLLDERFPLTWRLRRETAGSGAHGDLNAHLVDLARYITGLEFEEVIGLPRTFIAERPLPVPRAGRRVGRVTVDDTMLFLARLEEGAAASFEATRFAAGRKNFNRIEINGSRGSLAWCFERMNELEFYSREDQDHVRGFRTVLATEKSHPYVSAWWPPGHVLGYEHTFVNHAADIICAIAGRGETAPTFIDGLRCQEVLDAVLESVRRRTWVRVKRHKV